MMHINLSKGVCYSALSTTYTVQLASTSHHLIVRPKGEAFRDCAQNEYGTYKKYILSVCAWGFVINSMCILHVLLSAM